MNHKAFLFSTIFMATASFGNDAKLDKKSNAEAPHVFPKIKPYPDQEELATKIKPRELENQVDVTSRVKLLPYANKKQIGIPPEEKPYLDGEKKQSETLQKVLPFPYQEENSTDVHPKVDPY